MQGTVVMVDVADGTEVRVGQQVLLVESMKMHHPVPSPLEGVVVRVLVAPGDTVAPGDVIVEVVPGVVAAGDAAPAAHAAGPIGLDRADLAEVVARHGLGLDEARPDAVARRRALGRRTARANVADLLDADSFVEYGPLVIAAQRRRRPVAELVERTPADGLVGGIGTVDGRSVVVMSYDYTVLAGTQGTQNHRKKDRLFYVAERAELPVVFFTEGGGGRPGDTDGIGVSGLDCLAFHLFGRLSGRVPTIGIASGYCFAGNAAILGCCELVIATTDSNIGMGGPAMIEGGGLGVVAPGEIGPIDVQRANGVVDVVVGDEAEAVRVARHALSILAGAADGPAEFSAPDPAALRDLVPLDRKRSYDIRAVIDGLCDHGSVLELRRDFGRGMVTALARIDGRAVGVLANDPTHLAGAIDSDGADKAARFLQLCEARRLPVVSLVDTPGMMVGPEVERTGLVRHCSRLFVIGAKLTVPLVAVVVRKAYGLGAQAMMGGSTKAPLATVAWPTGEFGGMGLEGAVRLGYRNELAAVDDPADRERLFEEMVDRMYEHGKAVNVSTHFEIDDVIDPADTRRWITSVLAAASSAMTSHRSVLRHPTFVDTW